MAEKKLKREVSIILLLYPDTVANQLKREVYIILLLYPDTVVNQLKREVYIAFIEAYHGFPEIKDKA